MNKQIKKKLEGMKINVDLLNLPCEIRKETKDELILYFPTELKILKIST